MGLTMRNLHLRWKSAVPDFFRAGVEVTGFRDVTIDGFNGSGPDKLIPAIWLHKGIGATVINSRATRGKLLKQEGVTGLGTEPR